MIVRPYKSTDCSEVMALFYDTVHFVNIKDYTKAQVEVWAPVEMDKNKWNQSLLDHYTLVVEQNGHILGFCDLDQTGYLDRLYVYKDFQGLGIATTMLEKIESYARENKIEVITTHASITAKPFFEKKGYRMLKKQNVERGAQSLTNFVMMKVLGD
ncbi:MAG: GNAT family N-acetyltransferase [Turicibacter sp.]